MDKKISSSKLLILIRHGERCDFTGQVPVFGQYDPELTENGKTYAFKTGKLISQKLMKDYEFPQNTKIKIISSPFLRTLQTSRDLIKGFQNENYYSVPSTINIDCNLSECIDQQFNNNMPKIFLNLIHQNDTFVDEFREENLNFVSSFDALPQKEETYELCGERLRNFLNMKIPNLVDKDDSDVIIFISHGEPINRMNMLFGYPGPYGWPHIGYCQSFYYGISKETRQVTYLETIKAE